MVILEILCKNMSNHTARVIEALIDIATSVRSVDDAVNYVTRLVGQTLPELDTRCMQIDTVIKIPDAISQIGNVAKVLSDNKFLNTMLDMAGQKGSDAKKIIGDISKYADMLGKVAGGDFGQIFNRVLSLKFGIDNNTYTEFENIVQTLRNSQNVLSSIGSAKSTTKT